MYYEADNIALEAIILENGKKAWAKNLSSNGNNLLGLTEKGDHLYLLTENYLQQYLKENGNEGWRVEDNFASYSGLNNEFPLLKSDNERVYIFGAYGGRVAYDASTGKELWKY
jgi:outer membrane protein assembly factor BamB